ncbi:MAG: hypothetical protein ACE5FY_05150 [Nitrospiria bacterium]
MLTPSDVTVISAVPAMLFAVKVAVASPETVVAVGVTAPSEVVLFVIEKETVVPSCTAAPWLVFSVAVMVTVPRELTLVGVAMIVIVETCVAVVIGGVVVVVDVGVIDPVEEESVAESDEHPPIEEIKTSRISKKTDLFFINNLFSKNIL